jgi:hypothetical protein
MLKMLEKEAAREFVRHYVIASRTASRCTGRQWMGIRHLMMRDPSD